MMNKFEKDETFLARWIANELSEEELIAFKKTKAYQEFSKINDTASSFYLETPDIESAYTKVKTKKSQKSKVRKLYPYYSVAASILLILGLFWFINSSVTITAAYGKKLLAELPDGSKVHLNAGSEIRYKRFFWNSEKVVRLEGEAYFDVVRDAQGFKVISESGQVEVLGTRFNITDRKQIFEVVCYSGKVSVKKKNAEKVYILEKGEKVSMAKDEITSSTSVNTLPDWINGISIFKNKPLSDVLAALERQYDITIKENNVDVTRIFTGSFVHDNLSAALKTTLPVMGISYTLSADGKEVLLNVSR